VAKVAGEILNIKVEEGDQVAAGQVLATLDGRELRLRVAQAAANLKRTEQSLKRQQELAKLEMVSQGEMDALQYELKALSSELEIAKLQLSYSEIRAPIAGVISNRYIKVGNTLSSGDMAFHVTDTSRLQAELHVPQDQLALLHKKQTAHLVFDALPNTQFKGVVERVSPTIDVATGTFRIVVGVDDPSKTLRPGMFGRLNIIYDQHDGAVLIPAAALIHEDNKISVFVVHNGVAHQRRVTVGYVNDDQVEVISGLEAGDQVVTMGQFNLRDGNQVSEHNLERASYTF
ncbi:MAG: efflux RND transporter periplasmic adaptor subunit, partial [Pseudomonadota bacterium]